VWGEARSQKEGSGLLADQPQKKNSELKGGRSGATTRSQKNPNIGKQEKFEGSPLVKMGVGRRGQTGEMKTRGTPEVLGCRRI